MCTAIAPPYTQTLTATMNSSSPELAHPLASTPAIGSAPVYNNNSSHHDALGTDTAAQQLRSLPVASSTAAAANADSRAPATTVPAACLACVSADSLIPAAQSTTGLNIPLTREFVLPKSDSSISSATAQTRARAVRPATRCVSM
jgi:hypothetical protein